MPRESEPWVMRGDVAAAIGDARYYLKTRKEMS
ncbi:hypothetical protein GSU2689 [Geobacter sulfurreducens PCA]|uniref:Uncharacterized protein n=1 Tax=Geobacter sulfurreducens (strain ATCC 51573 / DSM 12127 / PCA) TaxID=243231 RepID=Q749Q3_GEOSL|nr:hypothetical protein GSU2689 [Geobacter sulfurreducens PCA]HBB68434.1 hypothetical protein [Geobacter sulfurreducens]HCD95775.1 hypothetical protein [Geobacter sulfurreducens]